MTFVPDELTTQLLKNNVPMPINIPESRQKVWFMEREDGHIMAVDENSAWNMLQPSNTNHPKTKFKIVGVSMGDEYAKRIKEASTLPDIEQKKQAIRDALQAEIEIARGKIEYPRSPNLLDISGRYQTDSRIVSNIR
jgi:hypothetical protein